MARLYEQPGYLGYPSLLGLSQGWHIRPGSPGLPWCLCSLPSEAAPKASSLAVTAALEPYNSAPEWYPLGPPI